MSFTVTLGGNWEVTGAVSSMLKWQNGPATIMSKALHLSLTVSIGSIGSFWMTSERCVYLDCVVGWGPALKWPSYKRRLKNKTTPASHLEHSQKYMSRN